MLESRKTVLLVTDFYYQAKGREYFKEDIELSGFLRKFFKVCMCHIDDLEQVIDYVDAVLLRNTGPKITHSNQLEVLKSKLSLKLFNDLMGKGDISGKQYLLDLFKLGFPVIPTVSLETDLYKLGSPLHFLLKPLQGADSHGIKIIHSKDLKKEHCLDMLIQPLIEFKYEVSFYFIGKQFYYALFAPNKERRWELEQYFASEKDIEFALKFINWNSLKFGIQRVDACRTDSGDLLLMELEDYNPFLSLDLLPPDVKEKFLMGLCSSLLKMISI